MGEPSSEASSKGIKAHSKGGNVSIFSWKPMFPAAVSLPCPAFALQPSLPAPLLNLRILECSSVNSLGHLTHSHLV